MSFTQVPAVAQPQGNTNDAEWHDYMRRVQARYRESVGEQLFDTDVGSLFNVYLSALPKADRQYHNCNACKHFINRYGRLVRIDDQGRLKSVMWHEDDAPPAYKAAARAMRVRLEDRTRKDYATRVTRPFLSTDAPWGYAETGEWVHFAVSPHTTHLCTVLGPLSPEQKMAEKVQDFQTVKRALAEFTPPLLQRALDLLQSDTMYRAEKVIGPVQWLRGLALQVQWSTGLARDNLIWKATATAPAGFCHPRSSMAGSLLEDLQKTSYWEAKRRFAEKMNPLKYQRPTAAPKAGTIDQAEKLFEQMGLAASLQRRYADLSDMFLLRNFTVGQGPQAPGVFGKLRKPAPLTVTGHVTKSWVVFRRDVLLKARRIQVLVPHKGPFFGLTTAVDPSSPPLLQWDMPTWRNPVSAYTYADPNPASRWSLAAGVYRDVVGVGLMPYHWLSESAFPHMAKGALFYVAGAHDTNQGGLGLFPETMRSELHGVRSVIEAYSRKTQLQGFGREHAVALAAGLGTAIQLRVETDTTTQEITIDRWE